MFTNEELNIIVSLCDLALKNGGLTAVNTVVPLVQKCQALLTAKPEDAPVNVGNV